MRIRTLALCAVLLGFPAIAAAGVIKGQLWIEPGAHKAVGNMPVTSRPADTEKLIRAQRGVSDAVIYVDAIPEKVESRLAAPKGSARWFSWLPWVEPPRPRLKRMLQSNRQFVPRVFIAPAGADIELMNLDKVFHNTFSVSSAKRFDLGKYPPGRVDTLRFDKPGVVNLHCDIHPDEIGYVVVVPNHAYASPDSLGYFKLPALPPGSYRLRYWHPYHGEHHLGVVVPRRGDVTLELSF